MKRHIVAMLALGIACFIGEGVEASSVTVNNANIDTIDFITENLITGADMSGLLVTATFYGGLAETETWAALVPPLSGGVSGTGWTLTLTGDSFNHDWLFSNRPGDLLLSLVLQARPGATVFDLFLPDTASPPNPLGAEGTPGSNVGKTFDTSISPGSDSTVSAVYSREVKLFSSAPYGDLYDVLSITFPGFGKGLEGDFSFFADTDNAQFNDKVPDPAAVPEPVSMLLVGSGLGGIVLRRRRIQ